MDVKQQGGLHTGDTLFQDKAGIEYWDQLWTNLALPEAVDPGLRGMGNLYNQRVDALLRQFLSHYRCGTHSLIEVGCARSAWLPYFARQFGFAVTGLDYCERGCEQERQILLRSGVEGVVICADLFDPPQELVAAFDVVVSFGVIEHFKDPSKCLAAMSTLLRPNGRMVTVVPNMTGAVGFLQRLLNRPVYEVHVPMTREEVDGSHLRAGMEMIHSEYFLSSGFGVVNLHGLDARARMTSAKRLFIRTLEALSLMVWAVENSTTELPVSRLFSPYIVCVSKKK
jgi:SAM-dependent methyltransferase